VELPDPPLLPDYQQYMRGINRGDQLVGFYNVGRRSRKWWKRYFLYLLGCSLLNAYVLHSLAHLHLHQATRRQKIDFKILVGNGHSTDELLFQTEVTQPNIK